MRSTQVRVGRAVAAAALVTGLAACSGGSPTVTGGTTPAAAAATSPAAVATSAPGRPDGGCPAGGVAVPQGAGSAKTVDLDGDGRADRVWLAEVGGKRTLGVRTASGAGFSATFSSAAPQAANALGARVGAGKGAAAIVLLDTGRAVALYAVTGCRLVESRNAQGDQYTFDRGFTGYGTGVGCPTVGGVQRLAGYLAETTTGSSYTVTRTLVTLSGGGAQAANGGKTKLGTKLAPTSSEVRVATGISCGANSADHTAHEPS